MTPAEVKYLYAVWLQTSLHLTCSPELDIQDSLVLLKLFKFRPLTLGSDVKVQYASCLGNLIGSLGLSYTVRAGSTHDSRYLLYMLSCFVTCLQGFCEQALQARLKRLVRQGGGTSCRLQAGQALCYCVSQPARTAWIRLCQLWCTTFKTLSDASNTGNDNRHRVLMLSISSAILSSVDPASGVFCLRQMSQLSCRLQVPSFRQHTAWRTLKTLTL